MEKGDSIFSLQKSPFVYFIKFLSSPYFQEYLYIAPINA